MECGKAIAFLDIRNDLRDVEKRGDESSSIKQMVGETRGRGH
jgi:hypothetical protein